MKNTMPPHVKYILSSPTSAFADYNITNDVMNWADLDVLHTRDATTGVFPEVTLPISLKHRAKEFVKNLFDNAGHNAEADFSIYVRDYHDVTKYTLAKKMPLDFSTYKEYDNKVEIEGAISDLNEYLNSFGKNNYDIPVADIREEKKWEYQRMNMLNQGRYYPIPGKEWYEKVTSVLYAQPAIYISNSEIEMVPGSAEHIFTDQKIGEGTDENVGRNNYFFKAIQDVELSIQMKFSIKIGYPNSEWKIGFAIVSDTGSRWIDIRGANGTITEIIAIDRIISVQLKGSERISLVVLTPKEPPQIINDITYFPPISIGFEETESYFSVMYSSKGEPLIGSNAISVIDPLRLMQKYLNLMAGEGKFTCEIDWIEEPYFKKIIAADSLRGFPETGDNQAVLHGTPNDFIDFMKVRGYEYEIDGNILRFKARDEFYKPEVEAMRLKGKELADLIKEADNTHVYTKVVAGYDSEDYESVNGRLAPNNGVYEYTTGSKSINHNELSLTSPYRADPIGMELLVWERGKTTTDTKSDNDIFVVAFRYGDDDKYVEYLNNYMYVPDSDKLQMFNAPFNPYYIIKRNESLIGINCRNLTFTATEANRSAMISVPLPSSSVDREIIDPRQDHVISKKIFDPVTYNFAAGHYQVLPPPEKRNGLIYFYWEDRYLKGYIKEIRKNYGQNSETTWILWAVK